MREPTFVIGGGQRCGTTWLYHLLDEHPQIYLAKPVRPEPKFFITEPAPGRNLDWYLKTWFADARDERAVGEKSTAYLDNTEAAERMKRMLAVLKRRRPAGPAPLACWKPAVLRAVEHTRHIRRRSCRPSRPPLSASPAAR